MDDVQEPTFSAEVAEAVAAVALMAAFADGSKNREEQARLEDVFADLGGVNLAALYQRVMLEQTTLEAEAAKLRTPELQTVAFETYQGKVKQKAQTTDVQSLLRLVR